MFVYLDKTGSVKEIVYLAEDEQNNTYGAIRQGSNLYDKIFIYFEDIEKITDIQYRWLVQKPNKTNSTEIISNKTKITSIKPFSTKQDLKFFEFYKPYKFLEIDLTDGLTLDLSGNYQLQVSLILGESTTFAFGVITFYVENSIIKTDHEITLTQYNYLLDKIKEFNGDYHQGYGIVIDNTRNIGIDTDIVAQKSDLPNSIRYQNGFSLYQDENDISKGAKIKLGKNLSYDETTHEINAIGSGNTTTTESNGVLTFTINED